MKGRPILISVLALGLMLALAAGLSLAQGPGPQGEVGNQAAGVGTAASAPLSTSFTYQGRLTDCGSPADGSYDFQFKLYDAASNGTQVGSAVTKEDVAVSDGLFTVKLDFGDVFDGTALWLEVGVRPGDCTGAFTVLSPRQELTATPYALHARDAWLLNGNSGTNPATNFLGTTDEVSLTLRVNDTIALRLEPTSGTPNVIGGYSGNWVADGAVGATIGGGGESGYVNDVSADYGTVSGGLNNTACDDYATVGGGVYNGACGSGGTVSGGGYNSSSGEYDTVGGGLSNRASGGYATVAGGYRNEASGAYATIGGGGGYNRASDWGATIAGGNWNTASGSGSTVGGGSSNIASGPFATVAGGESNTASVDWSTVGGGYSNTASDFNATVGGGQGNRASSASATVGGGWMNTASDMAATIGGGSLNYATGHAATVGGGEHNIASGEYAAAPGGSWNTAQGDYSFAVGRQAKALHQGAFVWADSTGAGFESTGPDQFLVRASGGVTMVVGNGNFSILPNATSPNFIGGYGGNWVTSEVKGATIGGGGASGYANRVTDDYGTVAGGRDNQAGDNAGPTSDHLHAAVGGGAFNTASGTSATVSGGSGNTASGSAATVGGGASNTTSGDHATVGGGGNNTASGDGATVGGGGSNTASGIDATVGGGSHNTASGYVATVSGGLFNTAQGGYSFAAGRRAKANNQGCFVWADSTDADVACNTNDAFIIRASGGVTMYTNSTLSTGATLPAGSGSWSSLSDRDAKYNFSSVDGQEVLARLAQVPISTWSYQAQNPTIRHLGPVAQDFYTAFGLGESERYISTVDADGVALAAIQGLYQALQGKEAQIAAQQQRIDGLEARVAALEQAVGAPRSSQSNLPGGWLLFGGLVVAVGVMVRRQHVGGGR